MRYWLEISWNAKESRSCLIPLPFTARKVITSEPTKDSDAKVGQGFLAREKFVRIAYGSLLKRG